MTYWGRCEFCGGECSTRDGRSVCRGVRGWAPVRTAGGTNHVVGSEIIPDAIAHKRCAQDEYDKRRAGIGPGQGALL